MVKAKKKAVKKAKKRLVYGKDFHAWVFKYPPSVRKGSRRRYNPGGCNVKPPYVLRPGGTWVRVKFVEVP